MKSLALVSGDLVAGPGGHRTVTGGPRIQQDLALALGEELGADPFHPEWGSVVVQYLGQPIDDETIFQVKSEVNRVVQQYITNQNRILREDSLQQARSSFMTADIVTGVSDVNAVVSLDSIKVSMNLTTQAGRTLPITRTVTL
jgi:phage baseplate assembly protein W